MCNTEGLLGCISMKKYLNQLKALYLHPKKSCKEMALQKCFVVCNLVF